MSDLPSLASVLQQNIGVFDNTDYGSLENSHAGADSPAIASTTAVDHGTSTTAVDPETSTADSPADDNTSAIARDEKGRFAKAPSSWKAEAKAKWESLDPEIQAEVDRREQDFHKGLADYKDRASRYDDFERAVGPYQAVIQSLGLQPAQAVSNLMATDYALRYGTEQQKIAVLRGISQAYNINLASLQSPQDTPYIDPAVVEVRQEIAKIQQQMQQREAQIQMAQQAELQKQYDSFANNKENEYFNVVREDMATLLLAGKAEDLQQAYDQAIWLNPDTRKLLIAKQQEQAKADQTKKAQSARKAASTNISRRGNIDAGQKGATLRGTLESVARDIGWLS